MLEEERSFGLCCDVLHKGDILSILESWSKNTNTQSFMMIYLRKHKHVVHEDRFERFIWGRKHSVQPLLLIGRFRNGVGGGKFDVLPNILPNF